jgi:hypothetical protein
MTSVCHVFGRWSARGILVLLLVEAVRLLPSRETASPIPINLNLALLVLTEP